MKTIDELGISPAPWMLDPEAHGASNNCVINKAGDVILQRRGSDDIVLVNNARLIAAAPEMYEALAAMLHCAELNRPYLDMSHMDIAMDMARKAIVKAEGEVEK